MKKLCIITGSRAEWGLFYPLASEIKKHDDLDLNIIATGAHVSNEYGDTYREIESDGFRISGMVDMALLDDTEKGIIKSVSAGLTGIGEVLGKLRPDMVFLLGDRFETFAAAAACMFLKIPIAHIHGGELTEGSIDDGIRHSITKMASVHFVSTDIYARRVIQMGEDPERVFNVGAMGIDNIRNTELFSRDIFEERTGFSLGPKNALVTFNPSTAENKEVSLSQFKNLTKALGETEDMKAIFTKPNPDMYSRKISDMLEAYAGEYPGKSVLFTSMGRVLYLSAMNLVDVVAGNSSSGIIEAPSFGVPTVNVGDRQKGRVRADSVIDCDGSVAEIKRSIKKALSDGFRRKCSKTKNPYGDGTAAKKIVDISRNTDKAGIKKRFFDVEFSA